jgi:DhnA family fructose-bisphosphate aldolase class Ia
LSFILEAFFAWLQASVPDNWARHDFSDRLVRERNELSEHGKKLRMNRIFRGPGRRALIVAFDHPLFFGPLPGTAEPQKQVREFAMNGADAILLTLGMLRNCIDSFLQPSAPALVVRLDWTSAWEAAKGKRAISKLVARPEEALRHGADAVITYLFVGTGDMEFEAQEIARNSEIARECERIGLPLIIEALARGSQVQNPVSLDWMKLHTRLAAELGADLIKTEYTGDPKTMRQVVELSPLPIFVLGGSRMGSDNEALAVVRESVEAGAVGVFFGRNVFQAANMSEFLRSARVLLDDHPAESIRASP